MRRLPLAALLCVLSAPAGGGGDPADIVREREAMLMTAAMAYVHARLTPEPPPGAPIRWPRIGHDIAALLVWDIGDVSRTPDFTFERNTNHIQQAEIFHAEANILNRVALRPDPRLERALLFATLEPCPKCFTQLMVSGVPRAVYCMEEPGLRDPATRALAIKLPEMLFGRGLEQRRATLPLCDAANEWGWASHGRKARLTETFDQQGEQIFGPFRAALEGWALHHQENAELLGRLRQHVNASPADRLRRALDGAARELEGPR